MEPIDMTAPETSLREPRTHKITANELRALFGSAMPVEAWELCFGDKSAGHSIDYVWTELQRIAAEQKPLSDSRGGAVSELVGRLRALSMGAETGPEVQGSECAILTEAAEALTRLSADRDEAVEALKEIATLEPPPFDFPADWHEQIAACPECERYKGHPIQQGICDTHRRPLWNRDAHNSSQEKALGYRAKSIARAFLSRLLAGKGS